MNWVKILQRLQGQNIPAVMVTVASTIGSTPREPGAKMIVTMERIYGTIGGGNLEHQASIIARSQLASPKPSQLRRFPLGAALGQCCGGLVNLLFEPIVESSNWVISAAKLQASGQDWVRVLTTKAGESEDSSSIRMFTLDQLDSNLQVLPEEKGIIEAAKSVLQSSESTALYPVHDSSDCYFIDVSRKPDFQLILFGAGHVGRAIVNILHDLPVQITWVDNRDDQFPVEIPDNVECVCSDTPEAEVDIAPDDSFFLVMTHDHALDQRLSEQILKHEDFAYFGLIGSASKRRMFETRMQRRGISRQRFGRMICPIGVDGIHSKAPAAIAISVAAELMQVYDQKCVGKKYNMKMHSRLRRSL